MLRSEASTTIISSSSKSTSTTVITPANTATIAVISHCITNQGTTQ